MQGKIWGSTTKSGFIKGTTPASCFMDVPLSSLKYVLNQSNSDPKKPRYEAFGVVVTKKRAYKDGCSPVLYLSNEELEIMRIPKSELWRVVRLEAVDGTGVNWVREREWRCEKSFAVPSKPVAVLVQSASHAVTLTKYIQNNRSSFNSIPQSIMPLDILCQGLPYLAKV